MELMRRLTLPLDWMSHCDSLFSLHGVCILAYDTPPIAAELENGERRTFLCAAAVA